MSYSYINGQYIGSMCNHGGTVINPPSNNSLLDIFSGITDVPYDNSCDYYQQGYYYGSFNGELDQDFSGFIQGTVGPTLLYTTMNGNLLMSGFYGYPAYSTYLSGLYQASHAGVVMSFSMGNAFISGNFNGNISGLNFNNNESGSSFLGQYFDSDFVLTGNVFLSSFSGTFNGVISGVGFISVEHYIINGPPFGISSNTGHFVGFIDNLTYSGAGLSYQMDGSGSFQYSGASSMFDWQGTLDGVLAGAGAGTFSGYRSGICQTAFQDYSSNNCNGFAPLVSNCNYSGDLLVQILYPYDGSQFPIYTYTGDGSNPAYTSVDIVAGGTVTWNSSAGGAPPQTTGSSGQGPQDSGVSCPYVNSNQPSCPTGGNGSILFVLENTDPVACNIYGPYSGWVALMGSDGNPSMYLWPPGPIPSELAFYNLSGGTYLMSLSGATGYMQLEAGLQPQGGIVVEQKTIGQPLDCNDNGGVVVFTWSGEHPYNYTIEELPNYTGSSQTGFVFTDVYPGYYTLDVVDPGTLCNAQLLVSLNAQTQVGVITSYTGYTCTGNGADASMAAQGIGGVPPYTYNWYTSPYIGVTSQYINNVSGGTYGIAVYDSAGCSNTSFVTVGNIENNFQVDVIARSNVTLICCQATDESDLAMLTALPTGGTPPYTYLWNNGATTQSISGLREGLFGVTVYDSIGCQITSPDTQITSTNQCLQQAWTATAVINGMERPDVYYEQQIQLVDPSFYGTIFPFTITTPGEYLVRLMMADGYGRNGTDCVDFTVLPNPIPAPTPNPPLPSGGAGPSSYPGIYPPDPNNPNPPNDPNGPFGGGGGGGGGSNNKPPNNNPQACCELVSQIVPAGYTTCQTFCTPLIGGAQCNNAGVLPAQSVAGNCLINPGSTLNNSDPCAGIWNPQDGVCCLGASLVNGVGNQYITYNCVEVKKVCDTKNYCTQMAMQAGYDWGTFSPGKTCSKADRHSIGCGDYGACCGADGTFGSQIGKLCFNGVYDYDCESNGWTPLGYNSTCEGGGQKCNGTPYCSLYDGVCCDLTSTPYCKGLMDFCTCINKYPNAGWTGNVPGGPQATCDSACTHDGSICVGYGEDGCQCDDRFEMFGFCCCIEGFAPENGTGACVPMECPPGSPHNKAII